MAGAVQQVAASHGRASGGLHALDRAGGLIDAPILRAGDEHRWDINGAAAENLQLRVADPLRAAAAAHFVEERVQFRQVSGPQAARVGEQVAGLFQAAEEGRLKQLLPLREQRMEATPFTFFRGSAVVMAADLANTPVSGLMVQVGGDAHCLNFGGFATPERNLIFDLNDFDETYPGPWEWDLKRLVTSVLLAARNNGFKERSCEIAALTAAESYRMAINDVAQRPALDVFYARLDATKILDAARDVSIRARRDRIADEAETPRVVLGLGKNGSGLNLFDEAKKQRLVLGAEKDSAGVFLYDGKAVRRAGLVLNQQGPNVSLADDGGKTRAYLTVASDGSGLVLADDKEKPRAEVKAITEGSGVRLLDAAGKVRAGTGPDGQGGGHPHQG